MKIRLLAITQPLVSEIQNCEQLIEYAGRKCTNTCSKTGKDTGRFVRQRIDEAHLTLLEHIQFTFEIDGISRACLAQLTRHRIASFSVQSQRYVKQNNQAVVIPDSIKNNQFALSIFEHLIEYCFKAYAKLLDAGILPEDARFVLPMAICTDLIMSMNLHSLLHLFELRCNKKAQWEIRELCEQIREIVKEYCPNVV